METMTMNNVMGVVLLIVCALSPGIYADMKCQTAQSLYQAAGCCNNPNSSITTMHESTGQKIELDFSLKVSQLVVDSSAFVNGTGEMSFHTDGPLTVMIARPLFGMFTLPVTNFSRFFEIPGNDTFETDGPTTILQYSNGSHVFKMTNFSIIPNDECDTSPCGYKITVAYSTKGTQAEQHKCHELGCPSNGMDALLLPSDLAIPGDSYLYIDNLNLTDVHNRFAQMMNTTSQDLFLNSQSLTDIDVHRLSQETQTKAKIITRDIGGVLNFAIGHIFQKSDHYESYT